MHVAKESAYAICKAFFLIGKIDIFTVAGIEHFSYLHFSVTRVSLFVRILLSIYSIYLFF